MRQGERPIATGIEAPDASGTPDRASRREPATMAQRGDRAGHRRRVHSQPLAMGAATVPTRAVPTDLERLLQMTKTELIAEFRSLYGSPPPRYIHRGLLLSAVAYQWQVRASGESDRALQRRLARLAEQLQRHGAITAERPSMKPGTQLLREWQGETHTVTVTEAGYQYREEHFASLSAIARQITGTAWSGPVFFGLKARRRQ